MESSLQGLEVSKPHGVLLMADAGGVIANTQRNGIITDLTLMK
jgi:hypothetical protein